MIARRVREWPRATGAVVVLAIGLVLVGVLVASAGGSGGAAHAASKTQTTHPLASTSVPASVERSVKAERTTITRLQASLKQQSAQLAAAHRALAASQASARCWQGKAHHPRKERAVKCQPGS